MDTYECTWGMVPILITVGVIVVVAIILYWILCKVRIYWHVKRSVSYSLLVSGFLLIMIALGPALYTPLKLSLTEKCFSIHYIFWNYNVPIKNIQEAELYHGSEGDIRIFGSGGLWGYLGKFKNKQLGLYEMYVTNPSEMMSIETQKGYIIVSCKKVQDVVRLINDYKKHNN